MPFHIYLRRAMLNFQKVLVFQYIWRESMQNACACLKKIGRNPDGQNCNLFATNLGAKKDPREKAFHRSHKLFPTYPPQSQLPSVRPRNVHPPLFSNLIKSHPKERNAKTPCIGVVLVLSSFFVLPCLLKFGPLLSGQVIDPLAKIPLPRVLYFLVELLSVARVLFALPKLLFLLQKATTLLRN